MMEVLLQELKLVSDIAPTGSHVKVAEKNKISTEYLYQIRNGKNMKLDTPENRKTMESLIKSYRNEISKYQKKLNEL